MNIFYLAHYPEDCAQLHCDKHVVKMVLETCQILATVNHLHGNGSAVTYKKTHPAHPCVKWAAASPEHYRWLRSLGVELALEYTYRYHKRHKCQDLLEGELALAPESLCALPDTWVPPPQCMPEEYQDGLSTVASYQAYYRGAKAVIAAWTGRPVPSFMEPK